MLSDALSNMANHSAAWIFDFDGTLVDSEPIHASALSQVLREVGADLSPEELVLRFTGVENASILEYVSRERGIAIPAGIDSRIEQLTLSLAKHSLRSVKGAPDVLRFLTESNRALAIASNSKLPTVTAMLGYTGLSDFFDGRVATRDKVGAPKPSPDVYMLAARMLSIQPGACVAVEDSVAGVSAARAADMTVIGFCPDSSPYAPEQLFECGAVYVVKDLSTLPQLIRRGRNFSC